MVNSIRPGSSGLGSRDIDALYNDRDVTGKLVEDAVKPLGQTKQQEAIGLALEALKDHTHCYDGQRIWVVQAAQVNGASVSPWEVIFAVEALDDAINLYQTAVSGGQGVLRKPDHVYDAPFLRQENLSVLTDIFASNPNGFDSSPL
jgi:hypothetical protein